MGDHGLYCPVYRKRQLDLLRAAKAGTGPYKVGDSMYDRIIQGFVTYGGTFRLPQHVGRVANVPTTRAR